jgi:hypothetical protein
VLVLVARPARARIHAADQEGSGRIVLAPPAAPLEVEIHPAGDFCPCRAVVPAGARGEVVCTAPRKDFFCPTRPSRCRCR